MSSLRSSLSCAAALAALLAPPSLRPAAAGPWTPAPGAGYLKVQARWLPGFGWNGDPGAEGAAMRLYGAYNEIFLGGLYAEIGVAPRLAVTVHGDGLRLFVLSDPRSERAQAHVSLGEPAVGLKLHVIQAGPFAAGLSAQLRAPLWANTPVQDVIATDDHSVLGGLRIGTGVFEGTGSLDVGLGLGRVYFAGAVGLTRRGGGWDSTLQWSVEGGWTAGALQRTRLRLRIAGLHPLSDGDAERHASPSGIGNGTRYVGFTLEVERAVSASWTLGVSLAGGLGPVVRQTGGPVITGYAALTF